MFLSDVIVWPSGLSADSCPGLSLYSFFMLDLWVVGMIVGQSSLSPDSFFR